MIFSNTRLVVVISFILFLPAILSAQNIYFEKIFGNPESDFARSVKQLNDSNIFVAGYSERSTGDYDVSLSKLTPLGDLLWTKYYGDSLDEYGFYLNTDENENFVIVAERYTINNGSDVVVFKIDNEGNLLWEKTYSTSVNESAKFIEQTFDGGYILCGFQNDTTGSNDILVVKLDSTGNFSWKKTFGGMDNDYADMIHQTKDGGYILTADTRSKGAGGYDIEVIKLDSVGGIEWDYTYGNALENGCQGILITSDNNYLSYGETEVYTNSPFNFYLELLDSNGTSIWKTTPGDVKADAAFFALEAEDKGFILTGYSNSYNSGPINLVVFKTDSVGEIEWVQSYGGDNIDIGYEIINSLDEGLLVAGKTYANDNDQFYLLHLDRNGLIVNSNDIVSDSNASFNVYPNPSNGLINFVSKKDGKLELFSVEGKRLGCYNVETGNNNILLNLNSGVYFLKYQDELNTSTGKIILKN